jgi:MFS family permease
MGLTKVERRITLTVICLMALRMMGLFLLIPVLPVLAMQFQGATPTLVGFSIGIYGLTQACLQIPLGWLSDRWGRRPVILLGLLMFVVGGVVAALSGSIEGIIVGRALQGSGAISSVLLALLADVSRPEQRAKLMAAVGISIGASFSLAIVAGPTLTHWLSLTDLFWFTAIAGSLGILLVAFGVPSKLSMQTQSTPFMQAMRACLRVPGLLWLVGSVLLIHLLMTAVFMIFPYQLTQNFAWPLPTHWQIYLPLMLFVFVVVMPCLGWVERKRQHKKLLVAAFGGLSLGVICLQQLDQYLPGWLMAFAFIFISFNILEGSLPSLLSRLVPAYLKGSALGLFASAQFIGAFAGGVLAGHGLEINHIHRFLMLMALICLLWGVLLAFYLSLQGVYAENREGSTV